MILNDEYIKGVMVTELTEASNRVQHVLHMVGWDYREGDEENQFIKERLQAALDEIDATVKYVQDKRNGVFGKETDRG